MHCPSLKVRRRQPGKYRSRISGQTCSMVVRYALFIITLLFKTQSLLLKSFTHLLLRVPNYVTIARPKKNHPPPIIYIQATHVGALKTNCLTNASIMSSLSIVLSALPASASSISSSSVGRRFGMRLIQRSTRSLKVTSKYGPRFHTSVIIFFLLCE